MGIPKCSGGGRAIDDGARRRSNLADGIGDTVHDPTHIYFVWEMCGKLYFVLVRTLAGPSVIAPLGATCVNSTWLLVPLVVLDDGVWHLLCRQRRVSVAWHDMVLATDA